MAELADTEIDTPGYVDQVDEELGQLGQTAPEMADFLMDQEGYGYAPPPTALDNRQYGVDQLKRLYLDAAKRQQTLENLRLAEQANFEQGLEQTAPQRAGITQAAQQMGSIADRIAQTQTAPTLPEPPKMQQFLNRDVASAMLSLGTMIGGINSNGSIRSIRANKALAGSINGFMEGNMTMAQLGLQDWKNQMTKQVSEFEMIRQNNSDILNASGKSLEAKRFELQMAEAPFGMKQKHFENQRTFLADAVKLDKEFLEINKAIMGTVSKVDPTIAALNLRIKEAQAKTAEARARQAEAGQSGKAPTTEEYRLMLQRRAAGQTTGNQLVDSLQPQMAQAELARGTAAAGPKGPLSKTFMDEAKKRAEQLYKLGKTDPEIDAALRSEYGYKYLGRDPRANYGFSTDYKVAPVQAGDAPTTQAAPAAPQAPSGGRPANVPANYVRVRLKANPSQFGWIDPVEFNPNIYERAQ